VPPAGSVAYAVPVDHTTGTAILTTDDYQNALSSLTVDGVSWSRMMRAVIAMVGGQLTLTDNGNGTLTATLLAQDGETEAASITYDKTSGARSAASIGD
jgi:hypothetical protein